MGVATPVALLLLLLSATLSLCLYGSRAQILPKEEVDALKKVAEKLKIPPTLWNFSVNPCTDWVAQSKGSLAHNISCGNCNTTTNVCHVVSIEIKGYNLTGVLPEEIGNLTSLFLLDLTRNYINGSMPAAAWASLPLRNLSLLGNRISGPIPEEIGRISTLQSIVLENNAFQGQIPRGIGNLVNLSRLLLSANDFTGELPETLGNLKNLADFRIDGTRISGRIPTFIGNWTGLQRLDMQGTSLEGPFPPEFSAMKRITELRISDLKNADGSFPPIEEMVGMQQLVLRNCLITGNIPGFVGSLTKLKVLDLSFNNLTGQIPDNFVNLQDINFMFLTNNRLNGSIPDWIRRSRQNLDVSENLFTNPLTAPPNCEQESRNYAASFSVTSSDSIASCLRQDLPCGGVPKNYEFFIDCGGKGTIVNGIDYESDPSLDGTSKYFLSSSGKWAYSSTGNYVGESKASYIAENVTALSMPDAQLYTHARLTPLSLKYYGLCLQPGNYTVRLHFAEIMLIDGETFYSVGRRLFDIAIQGQWVLKDFNIAEAANGTGKAVIRNFTALVEGSTLEILFKWSGKGTNAIPGRGVYGPLISAISVTPNFTPRIYKDKKLSVAALVGIVVSSTVFLMLVIFGLLWCWLRKKAEEENELKGLELPTGSFSLKQIKAATGNFAPENKIGEGGFGPVYKGVLPDGSMIAVKQLSSKSKQGNREFVNEIGMISALQHPNLVKLYGCCIEGNQLLLIYEYMENNSLARALFGPEGLRLELDWQTRRKICIGIARGLAYLHEESRLKIVHRDIKTTNVLLDGDLNAKISDFGLAKLDEEEDTHISTRIAGTMGYMAPEYAMRGYLTDKADVYSFGVVTLEIVSGKSNAHCRPKEDFVYLLDWAYVLQERGTLLDLVDPGLGPNFSVEEAQQMLNLALVCTNPSPSLRPAMSAVVSMLEGHVAVQVPAMKITRTESMEKRFKGFEKVSQNGQSTAFSTDGPWADSSLSIPSSKEDDHSRFASSS
ncbi:putative LRR receptor-like serine/threonine-protein kinase At1g53430 [Wolffia australiana]